MPLGSSDLFCKVPVSKSCNHRWTQQQAEGSLLALNATLLRPDFVFESHDQGLRTLATCATGSLFGGGLPIMLPGSLAHLQRVNARAQLSLAGYSQSLSSLIDEIGVCFRDEIIQYHYNSFSDVENLTAQSHERQEEPLVSLKRVKKKKIKANPTIHAATFNCNCWIR